MGAEWEMDGKRVQASSPCLASGFLQNLCPHLRQLGFVDSNCHNYKLICPGQLTCHSIYILAPAKSTDLSDIYARRRGERSMEQVISVHHLTDNYANGGATGKGASAAVVESWNSS